VKKSIQEMKVFVTTDIQQKVCRVSYFYNSKAIAGSLLWHKPTSTSSLMALFSLQLQSNITK